MPASRVRPSVEVKVWPSKYSRVCVIPYVAFLIRSQGSVFFRRFLSLHFSGLSSPYPLDICKRNILQDLLPMVRQHALRCFLRAVREEARSSVAGSTGSASVVLGTSSFSKVASLGDKKEFGPVLSREGTLWAPLQRQPITSSPALQQQAELVDHDEVRREREPEFPATVPLQTSQDQFLTLPGVENATDGPLFEYRENRRWGVYRKDPRQESTALALQTLYNDLKGALGDRTSRRSGLTVVDHLDVPGGQASASSSASWWGWITALPAGGDSPPGSQTHVRGLYMFGGVGTGKTMLMDMFVHTCPPEFKVRRIHFHNFMLDVHAHLKVFAHEADPLMHVGDYIAENWRVLALDEFFVTDIADASILNRLFTRLWSLGIVLVSTSNRAPDALYEGGLQRVLFLPFIDRLKENCVIHNMDSGTDYRRLAHFHRGLYFTAPDFDNPDAELEDRFEEVVREGHVPEHQERVEIMMGRHIDIARAGATICWLNFDDVCGRPTAAADFIALATRFDTVALQGIPVFSGFNKEKAYRFVTLVDVLYEHRCRLFCSAAASPFDLFRNIISVVDARTAQQGKGYRETMEVDDNLAFSKERCISRLTEMQSLEYLISHAEQHAPSLLSALKELQLKQAAKVSRKL
eukprot:jgi/Botrbrau1/10415/Bobra.0133s0024.1